MTRDELLEEVRVRWILAPQEIKQLCVGLVISILALAINVIAIVLDNHYRRPKATDL